MPKIEDVEGGIRVTFQRNNVSNSVKTGLSEKLPDGLSKKLSNRLSNTTTSICMFIISDKNISRKELAEKTGISTTAVQKHLNKLKSLGIIKRIGSARNGYWEVIDDKES
jgi:predicted HTH transcriptional regulator